MLSISLFDETFKTRLRKEIQELEKNSRAEIVVIIRAKSGKYQDISLWIGFATEIVVLAYLLFSPTVFNAYWISFAGLVSFLLGYLLTELIYPFKKAFISRKRMEHNVEVYARALFQKGAIYDTVEQTGLLVFVSLFEQMVYFVPDKGLIQRIPPHIWEDIRKDFNEIFNRGEIITDMLLGKLASLRNILAQYVPPVENDVNEIPDDLEVDL